MPAISCSNWKRQQCRLKKSSTEPCSLSVEFLHDKMQEKINVHPESSLKEVHELSVVELRLQEVVQWNLSVGTWNHQIATTTIQREHTDFVT